jgi:hypothetical protein
MWCEATPDPKNSLADDAPGFLQSLLRVSKQAKRNQRHADSSSMWPQIARYLATKSFSKNGQARSAPFWGCLFRENFMHTPGQLRVRRAYFLQRALPAEG